MKYDKTLLNLIEIKAELEKNYKEQKSKDLNDNNITLQNM